MFVKWAINDSCNLQCPYCLSSKHGKAVLSFEDKCKVIDKLNEMGAETIDFFGKEPLLTDEMFRLMDYADSKNYQFKYMFISNGVNLRKYTKEVLHHDFESFTISYEGNRGGRDFTFNLNDLKPFTKVGVPVELSIDVHRKNAQEVISLLSLFAKHGVASLYLKPIMPTGELSLFIEDQFTINPEEYLKLIQETAELKLSDFNIVFAIPFRFNSLIPRLPEATEYLEYYLDEQCYAGDEFMFLSCDGIAYGCGTMYYEQAKGNSCDFLKTAIPDILTTIKSNGARLCLFK